MNMFRWKIAISCIAACVIVSAAAKRASPKEVSPAIFDGIRYSVEGNGRDQYVKATEISSGNVLWTVRVFHNRINPKLEEDVQWVFITDLKHVDNSLLVKDERSRCYSVDLAKKRVVKRACDGIFSK